MQEQHSKTCIRSRGVASVWKCAKGRLEEVKRVFQKRI